MRSSGYPAAASTNRTNIWRLGSLLMGGAWGSAGVAGAVRGVQGD